MAISPSLSEEISNGGAAHSNPNASDRAVVLRQQSLVQIERPSIVIASEAKQSTGRVTR
jgi:hypothetical protein